MPPGRARDGARAALARNMGCDMTGLVLLHGFTGSPESFDELVGSLQQRRPRLPVLRPALLGHGAPSESGLFGFEREVDRLAREVRRARFEGAYLCGYS